jgi:metal-sulfur cluster biosynthetic enzyme
MSASHLDHAPATAPEDMVPSLDARIADALGTVYDPCSMAAKNPLSIVDMGLILGWNLDAEMNLTVKMCVTGPTCFMGPKMMEAARQELAKISELRAVSIELDPTVFWDETKMTAEGQRQRQAWVSRAKRARPQQWRELVRTDA